MTDPVFDQALTDAALAFAAERGWAAVTVAEAASRAGLDPQRVRSRFPDRIAILRRFGRLADAAAIEGNMPDQPARDRLFDALMRRFDHLQARRAGVLAVLDGLRRDPCTVLALAPEGPASMARILKGVGISPLPPKGPLRVLGLWATWLSSADAWRRDDSADLTATMAALDRALGRAERAAGWIGDRA